MSVREAFAEGSKREALEALRDRIAEEIDGEPCCKCDQPRRSIGAQTATLSQRLLQVNDALESLGVEEGEKAPVSGVASLLNQRERRRAAAQAAPKGSKETERRQGGRTWDKKR